MYSMIVCQYLPVYTGIESDCTSTVRVPVLVEQYSKAYSTSARAVATVLVLTVSTSTDVQAVQVL